MDVTLSRADIAFFHREGYLAIDRLIDDEEVAQLRAIYDDLFERQAGREDGMHLDLASSDEEGKAPLLPQILQPSRYAPELQDCSFRRTAECVARQLFGDAVAMRGEHMIYKPAHSGAATPWHQDQAYHDPRYRYRNVNFWLPLQEATEANGCMHFVPRSHRLDVLPHHSIDDNPQIHGIEVDEAERVCADSVACPLRAGGASLHHSYTLHYAGRNRSAVPRRAYILVFQLPPELRDEPLDMPWMRQRDTRAGRLRERAGAGR